LKKAFEGDNVLFLIGAQGPPAQHPKALGKLCVPSPAETTGCGLLRAGANGLGCPRRWKGEHLHLQAQSILK
jgi:hypothetical protein